MMYELKKFIFNKRNVGVFGFLVFFLVCFIGYNVYMDKHYNESQIKIYQRPIEFLKTEWMKQEVKKSLNFGKGVSQCERSDPLLLQQ